MAKEIMLLCFVLFSFFTNVQSLSCSCNSTQLFQNTVNEHGHELLLVLHSYTSVNFICEQKENEKTDNNNNGTFSTSSHSDNLFMEVFNETYKVSLNLKLNVVTKTYIVDLEDRLFYTNLLGLFSFPWWNIIVYSSVSSLSNIHDADISKQIHFRSKITILPADIYNLFLDQQGFSIEKVNYMKVSSVCNKEFEFYVDISMRQEGFSMYMQLGNYLSKPIPLTLPVDIVIGKISQVMITSSHMFILVNGSLAVGQYQKPSKNVIFYKDKSSMINNNIALQRIFYTPQCVLGDHSSKTFDTLFVFKQDGHQTHLYANSYPFQKWRMVSINNGLITADIKDLSYDYGRQHIIILVSKTNFMSTLHEITVLSDDGNIVCRPWVVPTNTSDNYKCLMDGGNIICLIDEELDGTTWSTKDGGCTFLKEISMDKLFTFDKIHFITSKSLGIDIFTGHNILQNVVSIKSNLFLWSYYGLLSLRRNGNSVATYYINRDLPISNYPLLDNELVVKRINETTFQITTAKNISWPLTWVNTTIVSPMTSTSCTVTLLRSNNTEILCKRQAFSKTFDDGLADFVMSKNAWFNVKYFSSKCICTVADIFNETALLYSSSIEGIVDDQDILMTISQENEDQIIAMVTKVEPNIYISFRLLSGTLSKVTGERNVCFCSNFSSLAFTLFQEDNMCPVNLKVHGINQTLIYLDVSEEKTMTVILSFNTSYPVHHELFRVNFIQVRVSNSDSISRRTKYSNTRYKQELNITFKQKWIHPTINYVRISTRFYHSKCVDESLIVKIMSMCPPDKKLIFKYPGLSTIDHLLVQDVKDSNGIIRVFDLPTNYQPPSAKGRGIPLTRNVYNADPSVDIHYGTYFKNQNKPEFKQCKNKRNRSACGCGGLMRISTKESESDCIEKVYRLVYAEKLTPKLFLTRNKIKTQFKYPLIVVEVNNRVDYTLIDTVLQDGTQALSMEKNSSIELKGSGLYHFKVNAISSNISFCDFQTEFIVYVDGTPFPYPFDDIVRASTAFLFGFLLLCLFLREYYKSSGSCEDDDDDDDDSNM